MKRILSYLKNYKKEAILAPLFKLLEVVFELAVPLVIASLIDEGIAGGDTALIVGRSLLLVLLAAVGFLSATVAQYFAAKAAVSASTDLRADLFRRVQAMNCADLDAVGTSTLLTRLSGDTNQVQSGINMALRLLLRSPFVVFGAMVMAFIVDTEGGIIFGVSIPVLFLVVFAILLATLPLYRRVQTHLDGVLRKTRENLRGVRVVRAFRMENEEIEGFEKENDALLSAQTLAGRISALLNPLTLTVINIAVIVLIYTGALRVESGAITTGMVVALYNYMSQILIELVKLANLVILLARSIASARRIDAVFSQENITVTPSAVPEILSNARLLEFCFGRNSVFGIAKSFIILPAADIAYIFHKKNLRFSYSIRLIGPDILPPCGQPWRRRPPPSQPAAGVSSGHRPRHRPRRCRWP